VSRFDAHQTRAFASNATVPTIFPSGVFTANAVPVSDA
jgi:hypothetical protein